MSVTGMKQSASSNAASVGIDQLANGIGLEREVKLHKKKRRSPAYSVYLCYARYDVT